LYELENTQYLLKQLKDGQNDHPIPDLLNATFHVVDSELSKLAAEDGTHSGCTAVTAFLRLEDENGNAVETDGDPDHTVGSSVVRGGAGHHQTVQGGQPDHYVSAQDQAQAISEITEQSNNTTTTAEPDSMTREQNTASPATNAEMEEDRKRKFGDGVHRERFKSLFGGGSGSSNSGSSGNKEEADAKNPTAVNQSSHPEAQEAEGVKRPARAKNMARRTLYTANVGDARAVLRCAS